VRKKLIVSMAWSRNCIDYTSYSFADIYLVAN